MRILNESGLFLSALGIIQYPANNFSSRSNIGAGTSRGFPGPGHVGAAGPRHFSRRSLDQSVRGATVRKSGLPNSKYCNPSAMAEKFLELAFTDSVRKAQQHYFGSSLRVQVPGERDSLGEDEIHFIQARDSFYLATVSESGWPYMQHRGGAPGFLHVIDPTRWRLRITKAIGRCFPPATLR